jgi:hypothetical protein
MLDAHISCSPPPIFSYFFFLYKEDNANESHYEAVDISFHVLFLGSLYLLKSVHGTVGILESFDPHAFSSHFYHMFLMFVAHVLVICSTCYVHLYHIF